jgi:hypothetical protein
LEDMYVVIIVNDKSRNIATKIGFGFAKFQWLTVPRHIGAARLHYCITA